MKRLVHLCRAAILATLCSAASLAQAQAPTITGLSTTEYNGGPSPITIDGTNFGATKGSSVLTFNGVSQTITGPGSGWSNTSITFYPQGTTSGNLIVTVSGASNPAFLTIVGAPAITALDPIAGPVGSTAILVGNNLSACLAVIYNGTGGGAATVSNVDDGSIQFVVPSTASGAGTFTIHCGSFNANSPTFTVSAATMPVDPGIQSSHASGAFILNPTINGTENPFAQIFSDGINRFVTARSLSTGLGPRFNALSCLNCHNAPTLGGVSTSTNQQVSAIGSAGSNNTMPSFLKSSGPALEARFLYLMDTNGAVNTDAPSGQTESLFTVGTSACTLTQPNFAAAIAANNIAFRTPTPMFGDGMIEDIDDSTLLANRNANLSNSFAISGSFNRSADDGTISRFGWKAQIRSLLEFAGLAMNGEIGVTNVLFPTERGNPEEEMAAGATGLPSGCLGLAGTGYPEDIIQLNSAFTFPTSIDAVSEVSSWARFLDPPVQATSITGNPGGSPTITQGQVTFASIGCQTCHNRSPGTTQVSAYGTGLSNVTPVVWSDFEIHHMGSNLADNIPQGSAGGDQFRTAPLWGLGNREFFMHDARDSNLLDAIEDHAGNGSEANTVIANFNNLTPTNQQGILNFLRSL